MATVAPATTPLSNLGIARGRNGMLVLMVVSGIYALISVAVVVMFCRIAALAQGRPTTAAQLQPAPAHVQPIHASKGIMSPSERRIS